MRLFLGATWLGSIALAGCDSTPTDPDPDLTIEVEGRLERGSTIALRLVLDDDTMPAPPGAVSTQPMDAVEWLPDGRLKLTRSGSLQLTASLDGREGQRSLEVATPPLIVFDLLTEEGLDIYIAALDGEDLRRLTTHPADDRQPTAAGGAVVFVSYRDGNAELYSMPLDGGSAQRLTETATTELDPALSPDGTRLAFTRIVGGLPKLFTSHADGSGATRATASFDHGASIEAGPSWAPDSQRLVFVSTQQGSADLWIWSPTEGVSPLVVHPAADVEPAWSPDGRQVAFVSTRDGGTDLYRIEVATGEITRLTDRPETDAQPAWLPDGRLVYTVHTGGAVTLRWMDPFDPGITHEIPIGIGRPGNPSGSGVH